MMGKATLRRGPRVHGLHRIQLMAVSRAHHFMDLMGTPFAWV